MQPEGSARVCHVEKAVTSPRLDTAPAGEDLAPACCDESLSGLLVLSMCIFDNRHTSHVQDQNFLSFLDELLQTSTTLVHFIGPSAFLAPSQFPSQNQPLPTNILPLL